MGIRDWVPIGRLVAKVTLSGIMQVRQLFCMAFLAVGIATVIKTGRQPDGRVVAAGTVPGIMAHRRVFSGMTGQTIGVLIVVNLENIPIR